MFFCWPTCVRVKSALLHHADLRAFTEGRLDQALRVRDHFAVLQVLNQERLTSPLGDKVDKAMQAVSHEEVLLFIHVFGLFIFHF